MVFEKGGVEREGVEKRQDDSTFHGDTELQMWPLQALKMMTTMPN